MRWSSSRSRRRRLLRADGVALIYLERLRTHAVQELLAAIGIAIGVALVFAVQVSNSSVPESSAQIIKGVSGAAQLQVSARDGRGFPEEVLDQVRALDGVVRAAPLLEQRATLEGPRGQRLAISLASADPSLAALSGTLASGFPIDALGREGVMLPARVNELLGLPDRSSQAVLRPTPAVQISMRGGRVSAPVTAVLGDESIGPLADARVAVAPLAYVQGLADLRGRVTRVLVEAESGRVDAVADQLRALAEPQLIVSSVDSERRLLAQAMKPNDQAAAFFAAVSALVGLLLAFNAMLLTAPERRRVISEMRLMRFSRTQIVQAFVFQALVLGLIGSLLGLLLGTVLARQVLRATPDYLASVFPIGSQTVVTADAVLISVLGGILVTLVAAAPPLLELRRRRFDGTGFADDSTGQRIGPKTGLRLLVAAAILLAVTNGLLVITPSAAVVAGVGLAITCLLVIPAALVVMLRVAGRVSESWAALNTVAAAVLELRSTTLRALALAAVGAVAVFGAQALEGGHRDLLAGLYDGYGRYVETADVWVVNPIDDLATKEIDPDTIRSLDQVPGVASARPYFGSFLDVERAGRRAWVIGRQPADSAIIPEGQVVDGDRERAERLVRAGGWVTVSDEIADALDAGPGDAIKLPTPGGIQRLRVAATTTNLGWTSGALIFNADDYRRAWNTTDPSAVEINVRAGASPDVVARRIGNALGPQSGLLVQTAHQRAEQANALARQGLRRLTEISVLLVFAAAAAMAAAMGTSIWQRRPRLASMRLQGFNPAQLWRVLLAEATLVLATGCAVGATLGVCGQWLIDTWLRRTTGFPTIFSVDGPLIGLLVAGVVLVALLIVAIPGWVAAHAPKRLAFGEQS